MITTLVELLAAERAAQLLREAESDRLARIARPRGRSGGLTPTGILRLFQPPRPHPPVAPPVCG